MTARGRLISRSDSYDRVSLAPQLFRAYDYSESQVWVLWLAPTHIVPSPNGVCAGYAPLYLRFLTALDRSTINWRHGKRLGSLFSRVLIRCPSRTPPFKTPPPILSHRRRRRIDLRPLRARLAAPRQAQGRLLLRSVSALQADLVAGDPRIQRRQFPMRLPAELDVFFTSIARQLHRLSLWLLLSQRP